MNKKGLTLVELLAVLVLLAIVASIAIPIVANTIKESRQESNEINEANIVSSTQMYLADNIGTTITFTNTQSVNVILKQLVDGGYITGDLKSTLNSRNYNLNTSYVTITKENNSYNYTLHLNTN